MREPIPDTSGGAVVATTERGTTPDGFAATVDGLLLVCAGLTIEIIDREARAVGRIAFPADAHVTNCGFAGDVLYVTDGGRFNSADGAPAHGRLWRVDLTGIGGMREVRGQL